MKRQSWLCFGALASAVALVASGVLAQTMTSAPTQSQIEQGLKTRGLPSLGTGPAPQGANPGVMPANVPVYPSHEVSRSTAATATAQPNIALNTIMFKFGS